MMTLFTHTATGSLVLKHSIKYITRTQISSKSVTQFSKVICFASAFLAGQAWAQEETNPYASSFKVELPKNLHSIYLGAGLSNELMHGIVEIPTAYGNFYGKIGQFYNGSDIAGQIGYRYPYKITSKKGSNRLDNVYIGLFAGQVKRDTKDGKRYNRLGGGADIGYMWFDSSRINTLSVGLYIPEEIKREDAKPKPAEPQLMFSFSMTAGLF